MKLIDRLVGREAIGPFLVASATFVVLIVGHFLFLIIRTVVERGVPLWAVIQFIWYQVPNALALALPVSMLLASALAIHRLARDNELAPIRAAGVSWWRLLSPVWLVGLMVSAGSFLIAEYIQPRADRRAEGIVTEMWLARRTLALETGKFASLTEDMWVLPGEVDDATGTISDLKMFWVEPKRSVVLFEAQRGRLDGDVFRLHRPAVYRLDTAGNLTISRPASAKLHLPETIRGFAGEYRTQENMSIAEILAAIRRQPGAPREVIWPLLFQLHHRISMATACLAFSLIGAPLSLLFRRGASMGGVLLAILFGFVYYVGMLWARMLGVQGALSPVVAAWLPNAVAVTAGALLLWRRS